MRSTILSMLVFAALFCNAYVHAQAVPSMAKLKLQLAPDQSLPLGKQISFEVSSPNALKLMKSLEAWQGIKVEALSSERLLIEMPEQPIYSGTVSPTYLADTFVIDFSESSIKDFVSGFSGHIDAQKDRQQAQRQPSPYSETTYTETTDTETPDLATMVRYVDTFIDKPTYVNGFNIASVVATQRSGDCTEYAVLLAALARSLKIPARVIIGSLIVAEQDNVQAFGHAWVEVWDNNKWHILDAAMYQSQALRHFYLPAAPLDRESPGYIISLASATALMPSSIEGIKTLN